MIDLVLGYKTIVVLFIGTVMDYKWGDPDGIPHPVVYIGRFISAVERFLRRNVNDTPRSNFLAGVFLWFATISFAFFIPCIVLRILYDFNWILGLILEAFWCFQILASKTLEIEALKVLACLKGNNLQSARKALSMIVGRDTRYLNREEITKAVIETVSENTTDGVIAPAIFIAIGGAPLGFLYKAINTLDSMVGYKSEEYLYFGKFSAIADDIANYLPARITGFSMVAVANFIRGMSSKNALKIMMRDHGKHLSPNGGWTEGATAGALGISLGGDATYFGKKYHKAILGESLRPVRYNDVLATCKLMWYSYFFIMAILILIRIGIGI